VVVQLTLKVWYDICYGQIILIWIEAHGVRAKIRDLGAKEDCAMPVSYLTTTYRSSVDNHSDLSIYNYIDLSNMTIRKNLLIIAVAMLT
jgi:hypothetical protein